jgi:hypothetical protein
MIPGVTTISEFARKYKLTEKQKTELITMQAFHQGIAILIGMGIAFVASFVFKAIFG